MELEAPVATLVDTFADVKALPVGDIVNEVKTEALVCTQAARLDEMRL